jgi:hypothetical protein
MASVGQRGAAPPDAASGRHCALLRWQCATRPVRAPAACIRTRRDSRPWDRRALRAGTVTAAPRSAASDATCAQTPGARRSRQRAIQGSRDSGRFEVRCAAVALRARRSRRPLRCGPAASLRGRNVLITGATGFLGKCLVQKILRHVPEVRCAHFGSPYTRSTGARRAGGQGLHSDSRTRPHHSRRANAVRTCVFCVCARPLISSCEQDRAYSVGLFQARPCRHSGATHARRAK